MSPQRRGVLVVDDDDADAAILARVAAGGLGLMELARAADGEEALEYLRRRGRFQAAPRPALVLLDIKLPGKDGFEVLSEIRGDPALKELPVVMVSGSSNPADVRKAYLLGANCYFAKPVGLDETRRWLRVLEEHWLLCALLP